MKRRNNNRLLSIYFLLLAADYTCAINAEDTKLKSVEIKLQGKELENALSALFPNKPFPSGKTVKTYPKFVDSRVDRFFSHIIEIIIRVPVAKKAFKASLLMIALSPMILTSTISN